MSWLLSSIHDPPFFTAVLKRSVPLLREMTFQAVSSMCREQFIPFVETFALSSQEGSLSIVMAFAGKECDRKIRQENTSKPL
jgi:hypothetical protein